MKLYEINEAILRLTDQITVDEETGEVAGDVDAVCAEIGYPPDAYSAMAGIEARDIRKTRDSEEGALR